MFLRKSAMQPKERRSVVTEAQLEEQRPNLLASHVPRGLSALCSRAGVAGEKANMGRIDTATSWNGILIRTKDDDSLTFVHAVNRALEVIASRPIGKRLLESITASGGERGAEAKFGYKICIQPADSTKTSWLFFERRRYLGTNVTRAASEENASLLNKGSVSSIKWNPVQVSTPDGDRPPFVGLAHELLHAYRNLYGESKLTHESIAGMSRAGHYKQIDEYEVVGIMGYEDLPLTENKIRSEHNIPLRQFYSGLDGDLEVSSDTYRKGNLTEKLTSKKIYKETNIAERAENLSQQVMNAINEEVRHESLNVACRGITEYGALNPAKEGSILISTSDGAISMTGNAAKVSSQSDDELCKHAIVFNKQPNGLKRPEYERAHGLPAGCLLPYVTLSGSNLLGLARIYAENKIKSSTVKAEASMCSPNMEGENLNSHLAVQTSSVVRASHSVADKFLPQNIEKNIQNILSEISSIVRLNDNPYSKYKALALTHYDVLLTNCCVDVCRFTKDRTFSPELRGSLFKSMSKFMIDAAKNLDAAWGGNALSTVVMLSNGLDNSLITDTLRSNMNRFDIFGRPETLVGEINKYLDKVVKGTAGSLESSINAIRVLSQRGFLKNLGQSDRENFMRLTKTFGINGSQAYVRPSSHRKYLQNFGENLLKLQEEAISAHNCNALIENPVLKYREEFSSGEESKKVSVNPFDYMFERLQPHFAENDYLYQRSKNYKETLSQNHREIKHRAAVRHGKSKELLRDQEISNNQNNMIREESLKTAHISQQKTEKTLNSIASFTASKSALTYKSAFAASSFYSSGLSRPISKISDASPGLAGMGTVSALYGLSESRNAPTPSYSPPSRLRGLAVLHDPQFLERWYH
ncbi:M91 family zinc metallopeptidase [Pseudomonas khavaziana]|uniref:M91 family zinc metallopeptidase n=1 Tax=Pseudomonas khavaziana TaxID=2842351 RepID=UPI001C3C6CF8|nr:M91 family zinc metallopeptidase [Pseudomonas khavaziana]MBV4481179.1 type III secretion system effector protein [Pseudomonas khavaziana]